MAASTDAPVAKRPLSAYWIWVGENRAEIVKALNGVAKGSEVSKKGGEMWKAMSAEAKAPYDQKAKEAKEALPPKPEKKAAEKPTGPEARKKPMTPVFAYIQENRDSIQAQGAKGLGDISKKGAELYKALPEEEKKRRQAVFDEALKSFNEWKSTDEGKEAMSGKKEQMQEKKAAKKDRLIKKESKAHRKATKEAKSAGLPPPEAPAVVKAAKSGAADEVKAAKDAAKEDMKAAKDAAKADMQAAKGAAKEATKIAKDAKNTTKEAPMKRGRGSSNETPAKRGKPASHQGAGIDASVLEEAKGCGYESALRNLANRPDVIASGKSSKELLDALKQSDGLVNPAKRVLLGGA